MVKNNLLLLVFGLILSSCYTKKRAIEKFSHQDTAIATIYVNDTFVVNTISTDTIFSISLDSAIITKDKLVIRYKKIKDTVYLSGEYKGDTIIKTIERVVKVPCNCPPEAKPTFIDKAKNWFAIFGVFALIVFAWGFSPWKK